LLENLLEQTRGPLSHEYADMVAQLERDIAALRAVHCPTQAVE
jgi:hypothetical protein